MARITIPVEEFKQRVANAAKLVAEKGLDVTQGGAEISFVTGCSSVSSSSCPQLSQVKVAVAER